MDREKNLRERNYLVFLSALAFLGNTHSQRRIMRILKCSKSFLYALRKYAIKNKLATIIVEENDHIWHLNTEKIRRTLLETSEE